MLSNYILLNEFTPNKLPINKVQYILRPENDLNLYLFRSVMLAIGGDANVHRLYTQAPTWHS